MKTAIAGLVLWLMAPIASAQGPIALIGKPMIPFKMVDTKGKTHTNASLKGKVVLLDFWASWCSPCLAASPTMQKLHTTYGKKGLTVIGVNMGERGSAIKTSPIEYPKKYGYTYTFTGNNDAFARKVGVNSIPLFIILDKKGIVRKVQQGWAPSVATEFDALIKQLLKG